jgi:UDP-2,4-diacetamido-2,4,6-trideoxy-beta-L-altropyranose hydrolase
MKIKIGIRVDSSNIIGAGHIYRCLIIAEQLKKQNIEPVFICHKFKSDLINLVKSKKFRVRTINNNFLSGDKKRLKNHFSLWRKKIQQRDFDNTLRVSKKLNLRKIIVDHYSLGIHWQKQISAHMKLIVIDDLINKYNYCDMYINYNKEKYLKFLNLKKNCRILLGIKNLICDKIYIQKKINNNKNNNKNNIFLFMGFADKKNFLNKFLKYLCNKRFYSYTIYAFSQKKKILDKYKKFKNIIFIKKPIKNLKKIYQNSNIIFSSAGTSMYEQILCKSNSIFFPQNSHQEKICSYLKKKKLIIYEKNINKVNLEYIENFLLKIKKFKRKKIFLKNNNYNISKLIIKI